MKVMLIMPYHRDFLHAVSLPLGILSIGTYLKERGHEVKIVDFAVKKENLNSVYKDFQPEIVGISFQSMKSIDGVQNISKFFKKKNIPVVWGGPFCSIAPLELQFKTGLVDIISISEGEETWVELLDTLKNNKKLDEVKDIAFLRNGEIVQTEARPFIEGKDLPRLDFSLVNVSEYFQYLYGCKKLLYLYLSKGCCSNCTFCINDSTHRCKRRSRTVEVFMDEVKELVEDYGMDGIYFSDEVLFMTKKEVNTLCDAFDESGYKLKWGFQTRIGFMNDADFKRVYDSGCRWIDFGVESGNQEMLKKLRKAIPYDKIEPTFESCTNAGIISLANFIIGLPEEREDQLVDTVELAKRIKSTQNSFLMYCFAPLTELGREVIESGKPYPVYKKLSDFNRMDFFFNKNTNLSLVPKKELEVIQSYFLWQAIFRKDYGNDAKEHDLFIKSIWTLFNRMFKMPFSTGIKSFYDIFVLFMRFFFNVVFYSSIRKKYNLK